MGKCVLSGSNHFENTAVGQKERIYLEVIDLIFDPLAHLDEVKDRLVPLVFLWFRSFVPFITHGLSVQFEAIGKQLEAISGPFVVESI